MSPRSESKPQGRILIADDEAAIANGLSAILSESSLAHAHGLLDRVFVIDRGAVAARS